MAFTIYIYIFFVTFSSHHKVIMTEQSFFILPTIHCPILFFIDIYLARILDRSLLLLRSSTRETLHARTLSKDLFLTRILPNLFSLGKIISGEVVIMLTVSTANSSWDTSRCQCVEFMTQNDLPITKHMRKTYYNC